MTRRLLDKKAIKISFNENPDDPEFNSNWDLNFSSDEDIFLRGKSEILWSRSGDLFDSLDSCQSLSDITGRTLSSCSWHNDEFDMKSSYKVNASLEAIDDALYDKVKSPFLNNAVFQECCDWAEKFPYFRVKGQQIAPENENFMLISNRSNIKEIDIRNSSSSLHLEGKKLTIHSANKTRKLVANNIVECNISAHSDEFVDVENTDEEYFAMHKNDQADDNLQILMTNDSEIHSTIKSVQEKIIDKLVSDMWPSVLAFLENFDEKSMKSVNNDLQLPPITVANTQKRALYLKRPNTEGSSVVITAFPKLDSILTVSPKILQKREHSSFNRIRRPNSEMSVNTRVSSNLEKSVYRQSDSVQINSNFSQGKNSKHDREAEGLSLFLPSLDEDFQDSANVLRGFHIEPHSKNSSNKTIPSTRNEIVTRESDCFLPPITDENYLPSNVKLTKNLFTFYGTPIMPNQNKYPSSEKYKKTNSRPNTSMSQKSIKNHEFSEKLPVNNELYITTKSAIKTSSNLNTERSSDVDNNETHEENLEKSVTLFPVVKSLIPLEDKNNSDKKGILHTFLRGKKR